MFCVTFLIATKNYNYEEGSHDQIDLCQYSSD
jgi:hypothetical protein